MDVIVVTGAAGHLGRGVVDHLLDRLHNGRIVAATRDPDKATALASRGVEVRYGDFAQAASLAQAFAGAAEVLIVSANKTGEEALRLHHDAIYAAREAGVGRILYTSHMGARAGSPFAPGDQHAGTEKTLAESGVSFTALRHGFYAESCLMMVGDALKAGELRVPEDGPVSWTARDDLAEADAAILASEDDWTGVTPPLTSAEALTMADLAVLASEVTGREVRHVVVTDDEWRDGRIAGGMPPTYAEMLLGMFRAARLGDFAAVDPSLAKLLGRAPRSMRDVLGTALA